MQIDVKELAYILSENGIPLDGRIAVENIACQIEGLIVTRAVAPVDGLETVLWANRNAMKLAEKNFLWEVLVSNRENYPHYDHALVARSQAVAIIAVKDEAVKDAKQSRDDWKKLAKDMQANNAAQHTSIVELEAERSGLEGDIANLEKQLAEAEAKLATANALVTCCCGDPVDAHNMGIGHSPVDQYHYAMMQLEADNVALIARVNGFEGFLDDLAEILGCERDIGDVVNELDAINNRAEALETQLAAAKERETKAFKAGYVLACCNVVHQHDEPTIAHDALAELGVTKAEVKAMNLSEFDMKALRIIERDRATSPYAKRKPKARAALEAKP